MWRKHPGHSKISEGEIEFNSNYSTAPPFARHVPQEGIQELGSLCQAPHKPNTARGEK